QYHPLITLLILKQSTYRVVRKLTSDDKIIRSPNITEFTTNTFTTSKNIGSSKIMPAIVYINIPININKSTIKLRITQVLTGKDKRKYVIFTGILYTVKILA